MAEPKYARVLASEPLAGGLHHLLCEAEGPLGGRAGQWLAIATEIPNPEKPGDVLRRAWSLAAIDGQRFELLVAVVGACTSWLATRRAGDTLRYTGPWGTKFTLDEGAHPVGLYATGSGISPIAALADAALLAGRPVALWWDTPEVPGLLARRIEGWRAAGAVVVAGLGAQPWDYNQLGAAWWLAGDFARLELAASALAPHAHSVRVERFHPLEKK